MKLIENEIRELYQEMTARSASPDCPGEEALIRVAMGDADPKVVEHMARCSDCAREYQIARALRPLSVTARPAIRWLALAAAAVIAVAALLLHQEDRRTIARLQSDLAARPAPRAELSWPQIGTPILDLDADATRGGPAAIPSIEVPTDVFTLILHLPEEMTGPLDIAIDGGPAAHTATSGSVTLTLSRRTAGPGEHVVHVSAGERQVDFRFVVK